MYPLIQQLTEARDRLQSDLDQTCKWLTKDAQPYLDAVGGIRSKHRLYRGSAIITSTFIDTPVRDDRDPRRMPPDLLKALQTSISLAHKPAHRGNSAFCTGKLEHSADFGYGYIAIPQGTFDYTWSPEIMDGNYWRHTVANRYLAKHIPTWKIVWEDELADVTWKGNDGSLVQAITSGNEIMISPHSRVIRLFKRSFFQKVIKQYESM